jgi:hypothetical protein
METTGNIDGKRRTVDLLLGAAGHRLGHRRSGWPHRLGLTDHLIGQLGQSARCNSNHHGTGDA